MHNKIKFTSGDNCNINANQPWKPSSKKSGKGIVITAESILERNEETANWFNNQSEREECILHTESSLRVPSVPKTLYFAFKGTLTIDGLYTIRQGATSNRFVIKNYDPEEDDEE